VPGIIAGDEIQMRFDAHDGSLGARGGLGIIRRDAEDEAAGAQVIADPQRIVDRGQVGEAVCAKQIVHQAEEGGA